MSVPREWGTLFLLYDVVLVLQIIHLDNQDNVTTFAQNIYN